MERLGTVGLGIVDVPEIWGQRTLAILGEVTDDVWWGMAGRGTSRGRGRVSHASYEGLTVDVFVKQGVVSSVLSTIELEATDLSAVVDDSQRG